MNIQRIIPGSRMSQAVIHGDKFYSAGVVADDPTADVAGQTSQILKKIDDLLHAGGTDKTKILMTNIWLSNIEYYNEINSIWDAWVPKDNAPARACVEARLAAPEYKVEIAVIAGIE